MEVELDKQDFAKYPFLKETATFIKNQQIPLDSVVRSDIETSNALKIKAVARIIEAVTPHKASERVGETAPDEQRFKSPQDEILSYVIARLIASCQNERIVLDRLARYEAARAYDFFQNERSPEKKEYVARSIGLELQSDRMGVFEYVGLASGLREDRWRLVNREVENGNVYLPVQDREELVKELIRHILREQLPLDVPGMVCLKLRPYIEEVAAAYQRAILEDFGEVQEESFPPCIRAIIDAVTGGTNITHAGRFALTAFLHTIGMNQVQIVEVFTRAPDFDIEKTAYQVDHISGGGGTEYSPPSCATMRTYGLCVRPDATCKTVQHPLSYYKSRKKREKKVSRQSPGTEIPHN